VGPGFAVGPGRRPAVRRAGGQAPGGLLALQRSCGNRAVSGLLATAGAVPVQRYLPVQRPGGGMDVSARRYRALTNEAGFVSRANVGWIIIGTAAANQDPHFERSVAPTPGVLGSGQHSEERLIGWAGTHGVNDLALAPNDPAPALRVKAMYTERHPCRPDEADVHRARRTLGSCHADLSSLLHPTLQVEYSVDGPGPFDIMLRDERAGYVRQQQVRRVATAYNARRRHLGGGYRQGLAEMFLAARQLLNAVPAPASDFQFDHFRGTVTAAADGAVAAIGAWTPMEITADATPGPPGPPPGPPGPGSGPAKHALDPSGEGVGKRVRTGVDAAT
jgi:hypothetical protein